MSERLLLVEALLEGLLRLPLGFLAASWAVWRPSWASWNERRREEEERDEEEEEEEQEEELGT